MRLTVAAGIVLMMTSVAPALSPRRLVVVVGQPDDPRVHAEMAMLSCAKGALDERDVVVQSLSPEAARRDRPNLAVGPTTAFEVLLVGKDGGVKLRRLHPVDPAEIAALIDTMPMRQQEMRR
jgi:hypothetical protein